MAVKPVPDGMHTVQLYLAVRNSAEALEFYQKAFGTQTIMAMTGPDGKSIVHAEMRLGDSVIMLTDENPMWNVKSPLSLGGSGAWPFIYVPNVDALFKQSVAAGCTVLQPPTDMFWGDRFAKVKDPYGHEWGMATHQEDVPPDEMARRQKKFFADMAATKAHKGS